MLAVLSPFLFHMPRDNFQQYLLHDLLSCSKMIESSLVMTWASFLNPWMGSVRSHELVCTKISQEIPGLILFTTGSSSPHWTLSLVIKVWENLSVKTKAKKTRAFQPYLLSIITKSPAPFSSRTHIFPVPSFTVNVLVEAALVVLGVPCQIQL